MSVAIPQFMKKIQKIWSSTPTKFSYEPPLIMTNYCIKLIVN
jgi:hypothetical protein